MSARDDHFDLGVQHSAAGLPRYRFQDPVLQERYDKGYNLGLGSEEDIKGLPGQVDPIFKYWKSLQYPKRTL